MKDALKITIVAFVFLIIIVIVSVGTEQNYSPGDNQAQSTPLIEPLPNTKIAFIGDTGYGANFIKVLEVIKEEQADAVVHLGDFDYRDDPKGFDAKITSVLGTDYPYLVVSGNHDAATWPSDCKGAKGCYATLFSERYARANIPLSKEQLDSDLYNLDFNGISLTFVGVSPVGRNASYESFVQSSLSNDNHIWKICNWHRNQNALQVGEKPDSMGWPVYDSCLNAGAIIATGHEHSYQRTKSVVNFHENNKVIVNPDFLEPDELAVYPGSTFVFVSGAGGQSIRNQDRCKPTEYPYGCNQEWASIYTSNQNALPGALFITFNVDGDAKKAKGYFKNINNEIIDNFSVESLQDGVLATPTPSSIIVATPSATAVPNTPTPSPTGVLPIISLTPTPTSGITPATPTLTPTNLPSITPTSPVSTNACGKADINNDGLFTIVDFVSFADVYANGKKTCDDTAVDYGACGGRDWDRNGKLDIVDFAGSKGFANRYSPKSCEL